jgi:hypothetical protein
MKLSEYQAKITKHHFTIEDICQLVGIGAYRLTYLKRLGIIKDLIVGKKSYYTWYDLVEIKTIMKLRENASLQQITNAKDYFKGIGELDSFEDKILVACENKIYYVSVNEDFTAKVIEITGQNKGQSVLYRVLKFSTIIDEIVERAKVENKVISLFEKRKFWENKRVA